MAAVPLLREIVRVNARTLADVVEVLSAHRRVGLRTRPEANPERRRRRARIRRVQRDGHVDVHVRRIRVLREAVRSHVVRDRDRRVRDGDHLHRRLIIARAVHGGGQVAARVGVEGSGGGRDRQLGGVGAGGKAHRVGQVIARKPSLVLDEGHRHVERVRRHAAPRERELERLQARTDLRVGRLDRDCLGHRGAFHREPSEHEEQEGGHRKAQHRREARQSPLRTIHV